MYHVLLVDDEAPALRFVQAIIEKYAPVYSVVGKLQSAPEALQYLQAHDDVQLLITDISMPEMDGISLARQARVLYSNIHIVVLSGFAEFDYAKGAIEAAVDAYLLKPLDVGKLVAALDDVAGKLEREEGGLSEQLLPSLVCRQPYDEMLLRRIYGGKKYHFAFIRYGNLDNHAKDKLSITSIIPHIAPPLIALYGRDENEKLILRQASISQAEWEENLQVYIARKQEIPTCIAVYSAVASEITAFPDFASKAIRTIKSVTVIGKRQVVCVNEKKWETQKPTLSSAELKKLVFFITNSKARMLKEYLVTLAADWERNQLPQIHAHTLVRQIFQQALLSNDALKSKPEEAWHEMDDLFLCASSYGDLLMGLYPILFNDHDPQDRKLSSQDLYEYAIRLVQRSYAEPLSIQSICADVGVSQTYLSRLFRKYGDTTFSNYLTKCRMEAAMALIREHPDILLRDVATCVGYDDPAYFSKVFHQVTDQTPTQYASSVK